MDAIGLGPRQEGCADECCLELAYIIQAGLAYEEPMIDASFGTRPVGGGRLPVYW